MDCPSRPKISEYLFGKLPEDQLEEIAAHLGSCGLCDQVAAELDTVPNPVFASRLVQAYRSCGSEPSHWESSFLRESLDKAKQIAGQDTGAIHIDSTARDDDDEALIRTLLESLTPPESPDELGRLGDFRVLDVLAVGGMGVVFRGEDPQLQRPVALKVLRPTTAAIPSAKSRFLREARAAAAIEHDHVIAIHQISEDHGVPFVAMPLLTGVSLRERLVSPEPFSLAELLRIGRETAEALDAAHQQGLLHRDVKPDNIWLEGKQGRVKILDFGLARSKEADVKLSATNQVVGTPRYMSPEQALGQTLDFSTDLFSLGCVLYRMATGKAPFSGNSATATLISVVSEDPVPIQQEAPDLPRSFCRLVDRLLAKQPADRYQSAREVVTAIQAIENEMQNAESSPILPGAKAPRESPPSARNWILLAFATIPLLVLLGVVIAIETDKGTLRIEAKDDSVAVRIRGQQITIRDQDSGENLNVTIGDRMRLGSGRYELMVTASSGLKFDTDRFEITRGQEQVLRVEMLPQQSTINETVTRKDEMAAASPPRPLLGQWTPSDGWLPLIPLVDPTAGEMRGAFQVVDGTLVSGGTRTLITFPLDIDGDYDLEATIKKWIIKSNHHVDFYLPTGDGRSLYFRLGIDSTNTGTGCCFRTSGIPAPYIDLPFSPGESVNLVLQMRRSGNRVRATAIIDGQQVTSCSRLDGAPSEPEWLSRLSLLELMPGRTYSDLRLRMVTGTAEILADPTAADTTRE